MSARAAQSPVGEPGEVVALVKAYLAGKDRVAASNVVAGVDESERVFLGMGAIAPPYDPETLCALLENSNSLRQNIDAYVTNIDAFGHRFEPVIDLDASDADQRIANAIQFERQQAQQQEPATGDGSAERGQTASLTPEEVAARKREVAELMRYERSRLESFFEYCCVDSSFVTLRRRTRLDLELLGNGYWEVLRDGGGQIVQLVYVPGFTVRLLPLDPELVEIDHKVKLSDLAFETTKLRHRFRRYVQVFESQTVYFKEFGDPRVVSRRTGQVFASVDELLVADPADGPATEILHFRVHNPRSAYGVPRWIGNLLAVLGSRQAEEVNFLYFENKSVPPLALLVSGGRLSAQSIPRIEDFIENHIRGKRNFHKILILEAEPPGSGGAEHSGRLKIELRPLTAAQHSDALFQSYDERNIDKVGQSFRLPRMLRGDIRDFNRSTADAALHFAESQVFEPERQEFDFIINRKILADMGIRFWRFVSRSPVNRDPSTMAEIIRNLMNANVLTPEEARQLAGEVFNREFKKISAAWVKQPVPLTLAGVPVDQEEQSPLVGPEVASARPAAQALVPPGKGKRGRSRGGQDLAAEASRLLQLRDALREAEARAGGGEFRAAKQQELETEVVHVPAAEMASWFEPEAQP